MSGVSIGDRCADRRLRALAAAVAVAVVGGGLASCSGSMPGFASLKPKPTTTLLLVESNPAGAEARASVGPKCITPCTLQIGSGNDFTVTFTLSGYVPQEVPVHSTMRSGGWNDADSPVFDPPSLFPTLQRASPAPAAARRPAAKPPA